MRSNRPTFLLLPLNARASGPERSLKIGQPPPLRNLVDAVDTLDDMNEADRERLGVFLRARNGIPNGSLTPDNFKQDEQQRLDEGVSGWVYLVRHKPTGILMARKTLCLPAKPEERVKIMKELSVLHNCSSPTVVDFYGGYYSNGTVHVFMEYMDCGSLKNICGLNGQATRVPENILALIAAALVRGLVYLKEQQQVIHRDIKPPNILLNSKGDIKLCDFGLSRTLVDSVANSWVGSRLYMSPELIHGSKPYSIKSDIWSMGITLIELATGRYPFPRLTEAEERKWMMQSVRPVLKRLGNKAIQNMSVIETIAYIDGESPTVLDEFFSPKCKNFIDVCLHKEPERRANLKMLQHHEFLRQTLNVDDNRRIVAEWIKSLPSKDIKVDLNRRSAFRWFDTCSHIFNGVYIFCTLCILYFVIRIIYNV